MFIGRERELGVLDKLYRSEKFEFAVIYGRRRVGKTTLINEFIKDKKAVYFTGVENNAVQNLDNLSRSILEVLAGNESTAVFPTFQAALESVFRQSEKERLIFVIDEYPYAARASKSLASTLQLMIDKFRDTSKMMLILCGSSMSYMEDHVLAYKAPLYGRRTAQLKIEPFSFADACKLFTGFSDEDKAIVYGIVGGTPQYLLQMDDDLTVEENIKNTFLNPASMLFEEPDNLLKQEVREPALYNAIITALANGASRMSEISTKVGAESSVCSVYIKNLISLGLVNKETPYGEKASRRSIYSIADNMFRFWYRFIPSNISIISRGGTDIAYKRIEPYLSDYMGKVFEEICRQYLWQRMLNGQVPIEFNELGRWWGTDARTHSQTEIDIMGVGDSSTALFGECKWTNEKADIKVLDTLILRSRMFNYSNVYLYLFAKSGFTDGCMKKASEIGNVSLVTYKDVLDYESNGS